jgi:hypothetical protein
MSIKKRNFDCRGRERRGKWEEEKKGKRGRGKRGG